MQASSFDKCLIRHHVNLSKSVPKIIRMVFGRPNRLRGVTLSSRVVARRGLGSGKYGNFTKVQKH